MIITSHRDKTGKLIGISLPQDLPNILRVSPMITENFTDWLRFDTLSDRVIFTTINGEVEYVVFSHEGDIPVIQLIEDRRG